MTTTTICPTCPYMDKQHRWFTDTERGGLTCAHCDAHLAPEPQPETGLKS